MIYKIKRRVILACAFCVFFALPVWADNDYPIKLEFEEISTKDTQKILKTVEIPEKIELWNPDMVSTGEVVTPSYSIARYDLNDDGMKEIFLYTSGKGICGSAGCSLKIYCEVSDKKIINVLGSPNSSVITGDEILILKSITNNYHDILLGGDSVWKWNGKHYDFSNLRQNNEG